MSPDRRSLGDRVILGAAWVGAGRTLVRFIGVISTLILARLLTPEDFGLVAVAMALVAILDDMSEFGFNAALIRFQDVERSDYDTAWTLNMVRGLILAGLLLALASPVAGFYGEPELVAVIAALALMPLLDSLASIRLVDFDKAMHFRPVAGLMATVKVVSFVVTIAVAVATRSYWALIAGMIVSKACRMGLSYWLKPYRPRLSLASWRKLMSFSGWLSLANALHALNFRSDVIVLQKMLATSAVGVFHVSKMITRAPFQEIIAPVRRVFFPGLAERTPGERDFREAYLGIVTGLFALLAPLGVGMALVVDEAVPVLLGERWLAAIVPMQVLALALVVSLPGQTAVSSVMASGRTRLWFNRNALLLPIRLGLLIPGAYYGGLVGAVVALLAADAANTVLSIGMANRVTGSTFAMHLRPLWRTLVSLAAMAGAVGLVDAGLGMPLAGVAGHAVRLVVEVAVGAVVYPACHLLLWVAVGRPHGAEARLLAVGRKLAMRVRRADG